LTTTSGAAGAVEVGHHRDRDDLLGGVGPLLGDHQVVELRHQLAGQRVGLGQALAQRRLAELPRLAVVRVAAGGARHHARGGQAHLAGVAARGQIGAAVHAARARGEAAIVDALVAGGAAGGGRSAQRAAGAQVGVDARVDQRRVGAGRVGIAPAGGVAATAGEGGEDGEAGQAVQHIRRG
jgi:hypothetical protein